MVVAASPQWRLYGFWACRILTVAALLLGAVQLVVQLRQVQWQAVLQAMAGYPPDVLAAAAALTSLSYAIHASYDLIGCRHVGVALARRRVFFIGMICHAFALSLGPAGAAFRFRLYLHQGVSMAGTAAVWLVTIVCNWLGFVVLAGVAFATGRIMPPQGWNGAAVALHALGLAFLGAAALYLLACALARRRSWCVAGRTVQLPRLSVALLECGLAVLHWIVVAAVLYVLLQRKVGFVPVLGALMTSALALAVIDVPAGLGVTETVFLTMLGGQMPPSALLAALVVYRGIRFVLPLLLAAPGYLMLEWENRRRGNAMEAGASLPPCRPREGGDPGPACAGFPPARE